MIRTKGELAYDTKTAFLHIFEYPSERVNYIIELYI